MTIVDEIRSAMGKIEQAHAGKVEERDTVLLLLLSVLCGTVSERTNPALALLVEDLLKRLRETIEREAGFGCDAECETCEPRDGDGNEASDGSPLRTIPDLLTKAEQDMLRNLSHVMEEAIKTAPSIGIAVRSMSFKTMMDSMLDRFGTRVDA